MSEPPGDVCAFCQSGDENYTTGKLQKTPDGIIVAHYNCMLYSPEVTMTDSEEDIAGFDFDIISVQLEIKRGEKLRCNFCRKKGATAGCNKRSCSRTYHYPCVEKAKGSTHEYVVYCKDHKNENTSNGPNRIKRARKKRKARKTRSKNIKKRKIANAFEMENNEGTLRSTSDQNMNLDINSEKSTIRPKVKAVFSLSGFPKLNKDCTSNKQPNEKLEEVFQTMSSQEKKEFSKIYSELGGGFPKINDCTSNKQPNEKLEEVPQTMSSQENEEFSEIYSELGGGLPKINDCTSNKQPDEKLEEVPQTMSSQENEEFSQIFSELNGGFPKLNDCTSNKQPNEKLEEVLQTTSSQENEEFTRIFSELDGGFPKINKDCASNKQPNEKMDLIEEHMGIESQKPTSMKKEAEEMSSKVRVPVDEEIENVEGAQPQASRNVSEQLKMETISNDFQSTNIQSSEDDDDAIFAKCLLQFLRKLPEDAKLVAKNNILLYVSSL